MGLGSEVDSSQDISEDVAAAMQYLEERRRQLGIDPDQKPSTITESDTDKVQQPKKSQLKKRETQSFIGKDKAEIVRALTELMPKRNPFAAIPKEVMYSPEYQSLSAGEMRTLGILFAYWNRSTKISRPTVRILVEKLYGIPRSEYDRNVPEVEKAYRQTLRWIDGLKKPGLVLQLNRGCRGRAVEYYLALCLEHIELIKETNGCSEGTTQKVD